MFVFLRSTCVYCHHFKLKSDTIHRYECKLRLLQHGLALEAGEIDNFQIGQTVEKGEDLMDAVEIELANKAEAAVNEQTLVEKREKFVNQAIANAIAEGKTTEIGIQTASILEERKKILHDFYADVRSRVKCDNCSMICPRYRKDGFEKIFELPLNPADQQKNNIKNQFKRKRQVISGDIPKGKQPPSDDNSLTSNSEKSNSTRYVLSVEVLNLLRSLFKQEASICSVLFNVRPNKHNPPSAEMFFIENLVVPPTRFRLPSQLGDEIHSNPQNDLLMSVLNTAIRVRDLNARMNEFKAKNVHGEERKLAFSYLMNALVTIQGNVNAFLDSTKAPNSAGNNPLPGIKQALEKKEGLFRKNMMGKRVNYAARSVISPDPNIETNEIGIPPVFAVGLTYPEPVTSFNFHEMRQAVINGPTVWPGAVSIKNEDGSMVDLSRMPLDKRTALANQLLTPTSGYSVVNKKVYRHIRNHDVVLMNRQPTLHKASMMGHKVRVLPGEKTLRLHYANTGAYNADFDGDEMNMHFPQTETARAEALLIANTDSQYLTPTSGKPLRGLIQDHISAGVLLTSKDTFFTREKYQQLVYGCLRPEDGHTTSGKIITIPPAIIKPVPMWTGKQVITTALLNIKPLDREGLNLKSKNKIKNDYWGPHSTESDVIFKNGELVCGILDKSQYGAADYGLVHSIHEIYGAHSAGSFLSVLGRLFTRYTTSIGFTCGMDDLHLTAEGDRWRREILATAADVGRKAAAEVTNLDPDVKETDPEFRKRLEEILRDDNKLAILDAITQSKVNSVASSVVSKCVPGGTEKRFPVNSMQSMALSGAKGSNVNVSQIMCLLGQQALEGRRVPVMVSGKTLPSFKPFDTQARAGGYISGRFFSGIKPQEYYFHCMAGREGLIDTAVKTSRSGYLQRCLIKQLEGVQVNYDNSVRDSDGTLVQFMYGGDAVDVIKESHLTKFQFCVDNYESLLQKHQPGELAENLDIDSAIEYNKKVKKYNKKHADEPHYIQSAKYDPVVTKYNPARCLGSVSEVFDQKLEEFIKSNPQAFISKKEAKAGAKGVLEKHFRSLMHLKYMQSTVDPGEAVGIIASESIGEPSTQMTLNTFHFAGHGAANVTLGIPRMREIIMTASAKIKTPQMTLPIKDDINDAQADIFCKNIAKIKLSEIVDKVTVTESVGSNKVGPTRAYDIKLKFYTREEYESEYDISQAQLENCLTSGFLGDLVGAVNKEIRKSTTITVGQALPALDNIASKAAVDDDSDEDEDADDEKAKSNTKQSVSYDGPDDEELEIMEKAQRTSDEEDSDSDEESSDEDSDVEMDETSAKHREQGVIGKYNACTKFAFDDVDGEFCEIRLEYRSDVSKILMVNIIENICRNVVVRQIPGIGRCLHPAPEQHGGKRVLVTEGVNFNSMWEEDAFIDVNAITSNDVVAVLKTYGVEAARNTIVREINNVFQTYAISVNTRHLDLIADMMTREGTYLAFNRQGVDSGTSPFMKMSFETTCQFLTKAVLESDVDNLVSPSSRIVLGKLSKVGTGSFDVLTPVTTGL